MTTSTEPEDIKKQFLSVIEKGRKDGPVDLREVAACVQRNCKSVIPLEKPEGSELMICGQDGTLYKGDEKQLEAWKDYYLPERMEMEVIGVVDEFPCDAFGLQLVLLLGEDGRVFAYEYELLHVVAENLTMLFQHGMDFTQEKTFKLGECFKEPTEEEYSEEIREFIRIHTEFRKSMGRELVKTMNQFRETRNFAIDMPKRKDDQESCPIPHKRYKESDTPNTSQRAGVRRADVDPMHKVPPARRCSDRLLNGKMSLRHQHRGTAKS